MLTSLERILSEGGIFVWPIILSALVILPTSILALLATYKRWLIPWVLWWAPAVYAVAIGILGTGIGYVQAADAISYSVPDVKATMAAYGISVALYTSVLGKAVAGFHLLALSVAKGLGLTLGEKEKTTPEFLAQTKFAIGLSLWAGLLFLCNSAGDLLKSQHFDYVANASPDIRSTLLAAVEVQNHTLSIVYGVVGGVGALAMIMFMKGNLHHVRTGKGLLSIVLLALSLAVIMALTLWANHMTPTV